MWRLPWQQGNTDWLVVQKVIGWFHSWYLAECVLCPKTWTNPDMLLGLMICFNVLELASSVVVIGETTWQGWTISINNICLPVTEHMCSVHVSQQVFYVHCSGCTRGWWWASSGLESWSLAMCRLPVPTGQIQIRFSRRSNSVWVSLWGGLWWSNWRSGCGSW